MVRYTHRQTSVRTMLIFLVFAVAVAAAVPFLVVATGSKPAPLLVPIGVLVIVAATSVIFSTLIVEVTDVAVEFGFLFGAMRRHIPRSEIVRVERSHLGWWWGIGARYGWKTIAYVVWPGPAVLLVLANGRTVRIGTDDADALLAALQR